MDSYNMQISHVIRITSHVGFSREEQEKSRIMTYSIQGSDRINLKILP